MKLKTRLVVAFLTVVILPVILSGSVIFAVGKYQMNCIEKTYAYVFSIQFIWYFPTANITLPDRITGKITTVRNATTSLVFSFIINNLFI